MKNIAFLILASALMLTACAPPTPAPTATEAATFTPISSPTIEIPTFTPKATATATETPVPTEIPMEFPIVREFEIKKFQELPFVSPEDAVTPAFDAFLDKEQEEGNLGDFQDIRYLEGYEFGTDKWQVWPRASELARVEQQGHPMAIVGISDADFSSSTFTDPLRRPERNAAYFKTKINSVDYLLFVSEVLNKDGTRVWIKYVMRYDRVVSSWKKYYDSTVNKAITLPRQYPDNTDFKIYAGASDKNYFDAYWQLHKEEMKGLIAEMQTGDMEFSPDFSKYLWDAAVLPTTIP